MKAFLGNFLAALGAVVIFASPVVLGVVAVVLAVWLGAPWWVSVCIIPPVMGAIAFALYYAINKWAES